jgi:hypothetical protein
MNDEIPESKYDLLVMNVAHTELLLWKDVFYLDRLQVVDMDTQNRDHKVYIDLHDKKRAYQGAFEISMSLETPQILQDRIKVWLAGIHGSNSQQYGYARYAD